MGRNLLLFLGLIIIMSTVQIRGYIQGRKQSNQQSEIGVGIMGDSNSDEYRADDNRGGEYAETTLNWMEQLAVSRDLNFGQWGYWGDVRRSGYEHNWALSGARTKDMINDGQHTGLAQQVATGQVSLVVLYIGTNDFSATNGSYLEIYDGTLTDEQLQTKVDIIIDNFTTAVNMVMNAGQVSMIIITIADPGKLLGADQLYPDINARQRASTAIDQINTALESLALQYENKIAVIDQLVVYNNIVAQLNQQGELDVGGERIKLFSRGDEPHNGMLNDFDGHPGTVLSGLLANYFVLEPANQEFGLALPLLSDQEILTNAGISPLTTPIPTDTPTLTPTPNFPPPPISDASLIYLPVIMKQG